MSEMIHKYSPFVFPEEELIELPLPLCEEVEISLYSNKERERERIIADRLETDEGRAILAQSMAEPIRRLLEYAGVGRRILMVDELPSNPYERYLTDILRKLKHCGFFS